ncbi:MAG: autoinducer synthase [Betaproteobacteria bacterium]|nr:autoinducer synthase [Betaproteobacteria bacterium]
MIECVTLETNHLFDGNPIAAQHRLRYRSVIARQNWDVPTIRELEYDDYDNPATTYLVARNGAGEAEGVCRLYPTDRPYMLQRVFSHLVTDIELPQSPAVWEASRFCVDDRLPAEARRRIIQEIVVAYLEYGLDTGITRYIGIMYPAYWRNIFTRSGWDIDWIGPERTLGTGHAIRAGWVAVTPEILLKVRRTTGLHDRVLSYGRAAVTSQAA